MNEKSECNQRKRVIVWLIDGDGCVFNPTAIGLLKSIFVLKEKHWLSPHVTTGNPHLFEYITRRSQEKNEVSVMCGSNRQSYGIDSEVGRMNHTGSFFPVLSYITDRILDSCDTANVELDGFLLADVFAEKPSGESYALAMQAVSADRKPFFLQSMFGADVAPKVDIGSLMHGNCPLEETKILWMYTVLHYLGVKYPEEEYEVEVHLVDDNEIILNRLQEWLAHNLNLIPKHVSLELNQYNGSGLPTDANPLVGVGNVDSDYRNTAKMMVEHLGFSPIFKWANVANQVCRLEPARITFEWLEEQRIVWSEKIQQCMDLRRVSVVPQDEEEASFKNMLAYVEKHHRERKNQKPALTPSCLFLQGHREEMDQGMQRQVSSSSTDSQPIDSQPLEGSASSQPLVIDNSNLLLPAPLVLTITVPNIETTEERVYGL